MENEPEVAFKQTWWEINRKSILNILMAYGQEIA